jgi:hypothetical protein
MELDFKEHINTKFLILKHYTKYKTTDYLDNDFFLIFGNTYKI